MDSIDTSKQLKASKRFRQRVVICGSMSFYGDMLAAKSHLQREGIPAIVPEAEDGRIQDLDEDAFTEFKRRASLQYLRVIRAPETVAILAVNRDKHGIRDYIGPNTFAEIAVAFAQHKRVFLLQGIPDMYFEELRAWGVSLDGDLSEIGRYYSQAVNDRQPWLFEDL